MKVHYIEKILIIDDLFSAEEITSLEAWAYTKQNYRLTKDENSLIHSFTSFQGQEEYNENFVPFDDIVLKVLQKFNDHFPFKIPNFKRVLVNCLTLNQFCDTHQDAKAPGSLSIIVYLNSDWKFSWGGDTYFLPHGEDSSYHISILPKPGRVVISEGTMLHGTRTPSQFMNAHGRLTLVFQHQYDYYENDIFYTAEQILECFKENTNHA